MSNYLPDSIYLLCGEYTNDCTVCSNVVETNIGVVHDSQRGKVFCPFGMGDSFKQSIFSDTLNGLKQQTPQWKTSTWGHVPQFDPRSLNKIGLEWRTS
jgi:hypothetical protein